MRNVSPIGKRIAVGVVAGVCVLLIVGYNLGYHPNHKPVDFIGTHITVGMTMEEVRGIAGKPEESDSSTNAEWTYFSKPVPRNDAPGDVALPVNPPNSDLVNQQVASVKFSNGRVSKVYVGRWDDIDQGQDNR